MYFRWILTFKGIPFNERIVKIQERLIGPQVIWTVKLKSTLS